MQIVIDVPNNAFKNGICEGDTDRIVRAIVDYVGCCSAELLNILNTAIPLPKGHGALKDADKLAVAIAMIRDTYNAYGNDYEFASFHAYDNSVDEIIDAPTIIEADREEADADSN